MNEAPLKKFAFTYQLENSEHLLLVEAEDETKARAKVAAMSSAKLNNEVLADTTV